MQDSISPRPSKRLLKLPSVLERVACSKTEWYRLMKANAAPRPIKLGARAVAWLESDVDSWIASLVRGEKQ